MFMSRIILLCFTLLLFSCSGYNKLLRTGNPEAKLEAAFKFYNEQDYYKALQLFENVIVSFRGTAQAENILFHYAYAHYHLGDFLVAASHFNNLISNLPNSQFAEEAMYMAAYSKYRAAPKYYLDQTNTIEAIREMQLFINKYPKSEKLPEANRIIDELRYNLEKKRFEHAQQFFKMSEYMAAIFTFQNLIKDFPGSVYTEEASFMIIQSWFLFAEGSMQQKQIERYIKVREYFEEFAADFPESKFLPQAKTLYNKAISKIENLQKNITLN